MLFKKKKIQIINTKYHIYYQFNVNLYKFSFLIYNKYLIL